MAQVSFVAIIDDLSVVLDPRGWSLLGVTAVVTLMLDLSTTRPGMLKVATFEAARGIKIVTLTVFMEVALRTRDLRPPSITFIGRVCLLPPPSGK